MTPQNFSEWRSWLGMTQVQVAERLHVNKRTVSVYESKGPIPYHIALACMAVTDQFDELDYRSLVERQHPKVGPYFIVLQDDMRRPSRYRGVRRAHENGESFFSADLSRWLNEREYSIDYRIVTVYLPDTRRRDVAVIEFDDKVAWDSFMWTWR